jgi:hypothetical protein
MPPSYERRRRTRAAASANLAIRRATASGRCRGTSWIPSIHSNDTVGPIVRTRRAVIALSRSNPGAADPPRTRTRGQDQGRGADAFEQPDRVLFPQRAEDPEVVRPRQTWSDPPLRIHADERQEDLVELGCDGDRAPEVAVDAAKEPVDRDPTELGGCERPLGGRPVEPFAHRDEAAVEQHRPADQARPADRELERHVRSPRVSDDDRSMEPVARTTAAASAVVRSKP